MTDIGTDSAVITWELTEESTGQVKFGETKNLGSSSENDNGKLSGSHVRKLDNLKADTTYFFRVRSADESGNLTVSDLKEFVTSPLPEPVVQAASNVNLSPSNWPSKTDDDLPYAGIFYGNHAAGVGIQNSGIGIEGSRRFRAEKTGNLSFVKYQNRTLKMSNITSRCEDSGPDSAWCGCLDAGLDEYTCGYTLGSSYHVGNGGTIVVELRTNTSKGLPSDVVLGKTEPFVPMDNPSLVFPSLKFKNTVSVKEGVIYHLVFTNLTPPTSCTALVNLSPNEARNCPRNQGAQGLNGLRILSTPSTTGLRGPFLGDDAAANFYRRTTRNDWTYYPNVLSWYELGYSDDEKVGFSYLPMESSRRARHTIGGNIHARQNFKVSDSTRRVNGVWLNFGHTSTANGGKLSVVLRDEGGKSLATGKIDSSAYCRKTVNDPTVTQGHWCQDWGYAAFGKSVSLHQGSTYSVEFSGEAGTGFILSVYEPLTLHGFKNRNNWVGARAELSSNGGSSWGDWIDYRPQELDLSVLFTIEGMPTQLK